MAPTWFPRDPALPQVLGTENGGSEMDCGVEGGVCLQKEVAIYTRYVYLHSAKLPLYMEWPPDGAPVTSSIPCGLELSSNCPVDRRACALSGFPAPPDLLHYFQDLPGLFPLQ